MTRPASLTAPNALPPRGVLLLGCCRRHLSKPARDRILGWIQAGGTLIVEAERSGTTDPLLDALGIERIKGPPPDTGSGKAQQSTRTDAGRSTSEATLPWDPRALKVHLPNRVVLSTSDTPAFTVGDTQGTRILGLERGHGRIVTLADFAPIENRLIGQADNAALFWSLIEWRAGTQDIVFALEWDGVSAWRWLLDHTPQAVATAALLIVLWIWRMLVRFGPVAPDPSPARRRLTDHLAATGRFLARRGRMASLIQAERASALEVLAHTLPGFAGAPREAQIQMIAAQVGCAVAEAEALIDATVADTPHGFVSLVRLTQRIQLAVLNRTNPSSRTA